VLVGKSLSGKTTIAKKLESTLGSRILDMNAIAAAVGARMTPEGEDPVPVPIEAVEKEVASIIAAAQGGPGKAKFVFDGYMHETEEAFIAFIA
jgi:broad-specificity NMP kinase